MRFLTFITLVAVASLAVGPVAAQSTTTAIPDGNTTNATAAVTNATAGPQPTATPTPSSSGADGERIDGATVLVDSDYWANQSVARLTLRSEAIQTVTLADAGAFREGGEVPTRTVALGAGETTTVELPVTERDGYVGVSISTDRTPIYAEIIREPSGGGLNIIRTIGPVYALLAGAGIAFVWTVIAGWHKLRNEGSRPEVAG